MTAERSRVERLAYEATVVLPPALRRHLFYARHHRRFGRFRAPRTFNEKVNWRILNDRRDLLAWTCDKLAMKDHARRVAPDLAVPATLWSGTDVGELMNADLPDQWVLKPNHRTQLVHFGSRAALDVDHLRRVTSGWLRDRQGRVSAEWAYTRARPLLFVEELISSTGSPPADFKVFVFDGVPRFVQVHLDRFGEHRAAFFDPAWSRLDFARRDIPLAHEVPRPRRLEEMLDAATRLGAGFDFMRVDLYDVEDTVWFGELTPYPGAGLTPFTPRRADELVGSLWTLPQLDTEPVSRR